MKYIKTFENKIDEPKRGDYIYAPIKSNDKGLKEFLSENVGEVIGFFERFDDRQYNVYFYNLPQYLYTYTYVKTNKHRYIDFDLEDIEFWSEDKEEVEAYIASKKYNL